MDRTIMSFGQIVRASQLCLIDANVPKYPLFVGKNIEYEGERLTRAKLQQIVRSEIDLRHMRVILPGEIST